MFTENKIAEFTNKISALPDRPQMSAQALKAWFDSSAEEVRVKFNALIDELADFANESFASVSYTAADGKLTFVFGDGREQVIDLPLELLVESGHYDAEKQSIVLTLANGDVLTVPVSDLVDTYGADGETIVCENNTFAVKDGVFAPEASADGKLYARKDGAWEVVTKGLEEIPYNKINDAFEGVYKVKYGGAVGVLCAYLNAFVYDGNGTGQLNTYDVENKQTILWSDGRVMHRSRADLVSDLNSEFDFHEDGTYTLKDGYVFYDSWSPWVSAIPTLDGYATKAYADEQAEAAAKAAQKNEFELIASGETTEEVNSIVITKDNDGNPFELCDRITIYSMCPQATATSNLMYTMNGLVVGLITNALTTSGKRYHRATAIYSGKKWDGYCQNADGEAANGSVSSRDGFSIVGAPNVNVIKITVSKADIVLPIGFKYEIYGRRVKK